MLISIIIVVISTALLSLQFFKQTKRSWQIAMIMCSMLLVFSVWNIKNQNDIQNFTIYSLEKIAGRILWEESPLTLSLQNELKEVEPSTLSAQVKILSSEYTTVPKDKKSLSYFFDKCEKDSVFEYSFLPAEDARELFKTFAEENGNIYDRKEELAGVERFWFNGLNSKSTYSDLVLVSTKLVTGANVNSNFTSLSDLNGSIILAYLNPGIQKHRLWPTAINWKLKTNAGHMLIHMPLTIDMKAENNSVRIHNYVGICIPTGFFDSAQEI